VNGNLVFENGMFHEENKGERVLFYVRIRPFSKDEMERDKTSPIEAIDPNNNSMTVKKEFEKKNKYKKKKVKQKI
jgi:hypothetical protein